ncbi:aspartate/glutamate racemase [Hahella sp. CCB-MM4]|uniref:aspartate/glutamate racemase family protein n=1 Tax=Hahella sp. (strain CCB-MM4) TaxID=1926491 RepID=UPI000B9BFD3D|nr:aspartate/glutamate racemase family protein [Hahella sp. CCB-MM4]OZG75303.1 aspartate/glutamate racemase [Hahella sp. CCB-MM4]
MKTLGVIGGMSWESTVSYYQKLNQGVRNQMGGLHSASLLLSSYDFADIEQLQVAQNWKALGERLADTARTLEQAGAEGVLIATNTMHKVADEVESAIKIPLLHIADATARRLQNQGIKRVALLGTIFTMQMDFYKERLRQKAEVDVLVPSQDQQLEVNRIIYEELCQGKTLAESQSFYRKVIEELGEQGAEGVILGCTEIGLLIQPEHTHLPLFDTTEIHCKDAVTWMLATSCI